MTKCLFFRGSFSIGTYRVDEGKNLIMGDAVTDAASWYEQPEFIGAVATPRALMIIKRHFVRDAKPPHHYLVETDIPCKTGSPRLFAINWPKAFYIRSIRPSNCIAGQEYACLLELLSAGKVPFKTEQKYKNTEKFFVDATKKMSKKNEHSSG